ncbi:MAG: beta-N-acetylhexosaminidase [Desulfobacula sp.]|nr:beta-N-acetylhexosaminidase [Desulfobacula sp.]MBT3485567.1 beta-N-acetylhexosaminidase [Desulfobacula sp.]MBT3805394.1 beta-N-acetylhexosaminidase [Desulfobacula sp.]MBT4025940.1 beta-N-acetylhexosaminidase [Desulfobacula sp.]MBT4197853.1 beta-N-acetylhexosaminidase [Desulfobacula sp.]
MAGQRLMLGFDGVELNDELKYIIGEIKACGIILFKYNIQSPEQVTSLCSECQAYAKACGLPPLFIAVDQEGGVVARLQKPFTVFKGNPFIKSVEDAKTFASITAHELKQVGINMNFAPVLDIEPEGVDSIMKKRVFKGNAKIVSKLGSQIIFSLQKKGVMAVAKHFPGIGRTVEDSHFHLPVLDIDFESLMQSDMVPFVEAKNQDVAGIMLSHILYPRLDAHWPASLSPFIARDLLRSRMGYDGLVMTDDLDMKAIEHDIKICIQQILISGIDMALICHKGPVIDKAYHEIFQRLKEDENLYLMGEKSLERILRIKKQYIYQ